LLLFFFLLAEFEPVLLDAPDAREPEPPAVMAMMMAARNTTFPVRSQHEKVADAWKLPCSSEPIMKRGVSKPMIMFFTKSTLERGPLANGWKI
jgi:hypothetical protein